MQLTEKTRIRPRLTLAAATIGSFVVLLDSTVVGIALLGGSLGDVYGERRLFVLGAAGFGVVSATDALVAGPIVLGVVVFALFLLWERHRARDPVLPLGLFGRSNLAWGNVETALVYGGLALLFFVLVVFLQQIAGYTALEAGAATIPTTVVLFLLSRGGQLVGAPDPTLREAVLHTVAHPGAEHA